MKKMILTAILAAGILSAQAQLFDENMGAVSSNVSVTEHHKANGFSNSDKLTFSGSALVQNIGGSTPSNTYTTINGTATSGANIRIADTPGSDLVISGINTKYIESPVLCFAILKGIQKSNGSDLALEYNVGSGKWIRINFPPLSTEDGSALRWNYMVVPTPLPQAENLSIRLRQTGGGCVFRIDDLSIVSQPK